MCDIRVIKWNNKDVLVIYTNALHVFSKMVNYVFDL